MGFLEAEADDLIPKIADLFLAKRYDLVDTLKSAEDKKEHIIENATSHFIIKQVLKLDAEREKKSLSSNTFCSNVKVLN